MGCKCGEQGKNINIDERMNFGAAVASVSFRKLTFLSMDEQRAFALDIKDETILREKCLDTL